MNILFIGGNFDKEFEREILKNSKGTVHYAANKFQWNIINGLKSIQDVNLEILFAVTIGSYPRDYNKLFISGKSSIDQENINYEYVSFINLWGYKNLSRKKSLKKKVEKYALSNITSGAKIISH